LASPQVILLPAGRRLIWANLGSFRTLPKIAREGHANHHVAAQQEKCSFEKEIFFPKRIDRIDTVFHPEKGGKSNPPRASEERKIDAKVMQVRRSCGASPGAPEKA
jgi:hypothetical protein